MEDKIMKQKTNKIKKELHISSSRNKIAAKISSVVYISIMILAILIIFMPKDEMPNKSIIIEIAIVLIFTLWTIFEKIFTNGIEEKIQKETESFEKKLQDYKKQLEEIVFIHDSITKKQEEKPFEGFEGLVQEYKDKIKNLEEKIDWININLEIMGENPSIDH